MHRSIISERPDILFIEAGSCSRRPGLCTVSVYIKSNVFAAPRRLSSSLVTSDIQVCDPTGRTEAKPRRRSFAGMLSHFMRSFRYTSETDASREAGDRYGQQDRATNGLIFFMETFQTLFPSDTPTSTVFRIIFSFWTGQE